MPDSLPSVPPTADRGAAPGAPVVLITGGAGGLGLCTARRFGAAGHRVALLDRTREAGLEASRALGFAVTTVTADVRDRRAVEAAVAEVSALLGPPSVLVNNAGIAQASPLFPPDDALFERTLAVNVTGAWIAATAVLPGMLAAGRGSIVNVASTASLRASRHIAAYVASKHALLGLTRALAEDLRAKAVRVNAVCPGFMATPMTERSVEAVVRATKRPPEEARAALAAMNASGRLVDPAEVADAILALALDPRRTGEHVVLE